MSSPQRKARPDSPTGETATEHDGLATPTSRSGSAAPPEPQPEPVTEHRAPRKIVLSIAGHDPTSGAGLTADLQVFAAHEFYGVSAATALTVQSTRGVVRSLPVEAGLLEEVLACLVEDLPIAGIKIGMLATAANVDVVAPFLQSRVIAGVPIVLDPVLRSSSGYALLDEEGVARLRESLLPLVTCVTPNTAELFLLTPGHPPPAGIVGRQAVEEAVLRLAGQVKGLSIVATGGHLASPDDCVMANGNAPTWLPGEWVRTPATHGTGCGYSSALLCQLVAGLSFLKAAAAAKRYITEALRAAQPIGHGGGAMHHLYAGLPSAQVGPRLPDRAEARDTANDRHFASAATPGGQ